MAISHQLLGHFAGTSCTGTQINSGKSGTSVYTPLRPMKLPSWLYKGSALLSTVSSALKGEVQLFPMRYQSPPITTLNVEVIQDNLLDDFYLNKLLVRDITS